MENPLVSTDLYKLISAHQGFSIYSVGCFSSTVDRYFTLTVIKKILSIKYVCLSDLPPTVN